MITELSVILPRIESFALRPNAKKKNLLKVTSYRI